MQTLPLFLSALKPYWLKVVVALVLSFAGVLLEVVAFVSIVPLFGLLGAGSLGGQNSPVLTIMRSVYEPLGIPYTATGVLAGIAVLFVLKAAATIVSEQMMVVISARYERDSRDELWDSLFMARWEFVQRQKSGDILNVLMNQAARSGFVLSQFLHVVVLVFTVMVYVAFAFAVSPIATLLLVLAVGVTGVLAAYVYRTTTRWAARMVGVHSVLYQKYSEFVAGYALMRATASDAVARTQLRGRTEEVRRYEVRTGLVKSLFGSALEPGIAIAIAGVLVLQALGGFQLSSLGAVGLLLFRSFQRVYGVTVSVGGLGESVPSLQAVHEWREKLGSHLESSGGGAVAGFQTLEFRGVSYHYPDGPNVVEDLDLRIENGEFLGIIGASGSGKTTLIGLTLGLLRPTGGEITLNGQPFDRVGARQWRAKVGYVPQDTVLFTGTVQENISMWSDAVTPDEVRRAAGIAQASGFIEALPAGYESLVGERGVNFSGGQKQRLALARAIVRKPEVLLLDEATSSLDSIAEREFQDALERARQRFTVIAVAHRLSTVMNADRIIVMEGGRLVESGPPARLLELPDGKFRAMYQGQTTAEAGQVRASPN